MARTRLFAELRRIAQLTRAVQARGSNSKEDVLFRLREWRMQRRAAMGIGVVWLAGLLGALTSRCDGPRKLSERVVQNQGRVAIIGAGLAGLHCAYRLGQAGVQAKVFEASSRIGGRTFTDRQSFAPQVVELGGEFIDSNHVTLLTLAAELDIALDDREQDLDLSTTRDVWWVQGEQVAEHVIVEQFSAVAPLIAELVEQAETDEAVFNELDNISLAEWLTEYISPRNYPELHAVLMAAYRGEYGLEPEHQSVLNLLYLIGSDEPDPFRIFGESDERFHTHSGSQSFCERLRDGWGGEVELQTKLVAARRSAEVVYTVSFERDGERFDEEFDHVVFALPFTALRDVDLSGLRLPVAKSQMIQHLGYGTNAKVLGAFEARVWRQDHDAAGSVTSDEELQQCWDSSAGQPGPAGVLTNFLGGDQGVACGQGSAEDWYRQVTLNGVEPVFPGARAAYVEGSAIRMHWPSHPYSRGSYACYRPGQWAFWSHEGERFENLHFCGEHTSLDFQGYMEGAAETGARVAGEILSTLHIVPTDIHRGLLDLWRDLPKRTASGGPAIAARRRLLNERLCALVSAFDA